MGKRHGVEHTVAICSWESINEQQSIRLLSEWRGWILINSNDVPWGLLHLCCGVIPLLQLLINALPPHRRRSLLDICFYIWDVIIFMQSKRGCSHHATVYAKQQQGNVPPIQTRCVTFSTEKSSEPGTWLTNRTIRPSAALSHKFTLLCDAW